MISLPNLLLKESHHGKDQSVGAILASFFDGDFHFGSSRPSGKISLVWQESNDKHAWRCSTFHKVYEGGWTSNSLQETHWSAGDVTLHKKGRVTFKEFDANKTANTPFWAREWQSMGVNAWLDDVYAFDVRNCLPVQSFMYDVLFNFESPFQVADTHAKHAILCIHTNAPLSAGCKKILHDLLYVKSALRTKFLRNAFKNKGLHEDTPLQIIVRAPHTYLSEHAVNFLKAPLDLEKPLSRLVFLGRSHAHKEHNHEHHDHKDQKDHHDHHIHEVHPHSHKEDHPILKHEEVHKPIKLDTPKNPHTTLGDSDLHSPKSPVQHQETAKKGRYRW